MRPNRILGVWAISFLFLPYPVAAQSKEQSGAIVAAEMGIPITEESLVARLRDRNRGVAAIAASAFPALEKSQRAVEALQAATGKDSPDIVFLNAIQSLKFWNVAVPGWENDLIDRMGRSRSKSDQMMMAQVLAVVAGRGDGWPILAKELADEKSTYAASAISRVSSFDGLKDKDGKAIDVVSELQKARATAAPSIREKIDRKSSEHRRRREALHWTFMMVLVQNERVSFDCSDPNTVTVSLLRVSKGKSAAKAE